MKHKNIPGAHKRHFNLKKLNSVDLFVLDTALPKFLAFGQNQKHPFSHDAG